MKRTLPPVLIALAVALALGVPRVAGAQGNRWERQVRDQLHRAVAALAGNASRHAELTRTGVLNAEEGEWFAVTLHAGVSYSMIGVCDEDCSSLQLVLGTASNEVAADRHGESYPVLHVTPRETGPYRVKVAMAVCRQNPCWYGVAVYRN